MARARLRDRHQKVLGEKLISLKKEVFNFYFYYRKNLILKKARF
jgi:hypothetical protein